MWIAGEVSIEIGGEEFFPWLFKECGIDDDDIDADPIVDIGFRGVEQLTGIVIQTKYARVIELGTEEFWQFVSMQLPKLIQKHEWIASVPRWENDAVAMTVAFDTENHPTRWAEPPTFLRK